MAQNSKKVRESNRRGVPENLKIKLPTSSPPSGGEFSNFHTLKKCSPPIAGESSNFRCQKSRNSLPAKWRGVLYIRIKNQQPCPPHVAGSPLRLSPQIFVASSNFCWSKISTSHSPPIGGESLESKLRQLRKGTKIPLQLSYYKNDTCRCRILGRQKNT